MNLHKVFAEQHYTNSILFQMAFYASFAGINWYFMPRIQVLTEILCLTYGYYVTFYASCAGIN